MSQDSMIRHATPEEVRLMEEAIVRALALGRPFHEHEVFAPAWELGYELCPALDPERFVLCREGCWQGRGENTRFVPPLWTVRMPDIVHDAPDVERERAEDAAFSAGLIDSRIHVLECLRSGDFAVPELEETMVIRRLSVRASAQVDCENGELEMGDENGLHLYDVHEALELRELLNQVYPVLYRLANA